MKKQSIALMAALSAASVIVSNASAAIEQHSVNYSYSEVANQGIYPRLTLPGFDDMGGQRTLSRVLVRVEAELSTAFSVENMTSSPLTDWTVETTHLILTGFERENPETFGPFAFMGGLETEPLTATLAPKDGIAGSGGDFITGSDSTFIDSTIEMDPSFLSFYSGGGQIIAVVGPFTELLLSNITAYDPFMETGDASVQFTELAQHGTFTLIYEYTAIPEPTTAMATLPLAAALLRRRR